MITARKLDPNSSFQHNQISELDNQPQMSAAELKAKFDAAMKNVMVPAYNSMIDDLSGTADNASGADNIGATPLASGSANTVQGVLEEMNGRIFPVAAVNVTLTTAGWSSGQQTVSVSGVTAASKIVVGIAGAASSAARAAARSAYIYATAQGAGTVTFTCDGTAPTANIQMVILIVG